MGKEGAPTGDHKHKEKTRKVKSGQIVEFNRHDLMKIYHRFSVKRQSRQSPGLPIPNIEVQLGRIDAEKKRKRYRAALSNAIPEVLASDMNATPQEAFRKVGRVAVLMKGENP